MIMKLKILSGDIKSTNSDKLEEILKNKIK